MKKMSKLEQREYKSIRLNKLKKNYIQTPTDEVRHLVGVKLRMKRNDGYIHLEAESEN